MHFDGSDVGLAGSDINGIHIEDPDPGTEDVFLTTKDEYSVPGNPVDPLSGDQEEIFYTDTSGTFSLFWNGDEHDFAGERLEGSTLGP